VKLRVAESSARKLLKNLIAEKKCFQSARRILLTISEDKEVE